MDINLQNLRYSIIGLGLIGGSLAKALRKYINPGHIYGLDRDEESLALALKEGVITSGKTVPDEDIYHSDVIFLCTPLKHIFSIIDDLAANVGKNSIITDVSSTKGEIVRYMESMDNPPSFVGGHPMTGSEKTGYRFSSAHLFENAFYVLCPVKNSTGIPPLFLKEIILKIGGIPIEMDGETHDNTVAFVSHVPHVIASGLVNLIKESDTGKEYMKMLAAGGFKDITRIASANPSLWQNIVSSNKEHVIDVLITFSQHLNSFIGDLSQNHMENIYDFFESAGKYRDSLPKGGKGIIDSVYEITVDVVDRPGIIGEMATLLGNNQINIKNINVTNSREFEGGSIVISLSDRQSRDRALFLLSETGYRVYKR